MRCEDEDDLVVLHSRPEAREDSDERIELSAGNAGEE